MSPGLLPALARICNLSEGNGPIRQNRIFNLQIPVHFFLVPVDLKSKV